MFVSKWWRAGDPSRAHRAVCSWTGIGSAPPQPVKDHLFKNKQTKNNKWHKSAVKVEDAHCRTPTTLNAKEGLWFGVFLFQDQSLGNWRLKRQVDNGEEVIYKFSPKFVLKSGQTVTVSVLFDRCCSQSHGPFPLHSPSMTPLASIQLGFLCVCFDRPSVKVQWQDIVQIQTFVCFVLVWMFTP